MSIAKTITELDAYCRLHNRVLRAKECKFPDCKTVSYIVDDSDQYQVNTK